MFFDKADRFGVTGWAFNSGSGEEVRHNYNTAIQLLNKHTVNEKGRKQEDHNTLRVVYWASRTNPSLSIPYLTQKDDVICKERKRQMIFDTNDTLFPITDV